MPRYFFDAHENGQFTRDDSGTVLESVDAARVEAMGYLTAIAKDEVARDGDRQASTVVVKDEAGRSIYSGTLSFAGVWLEPKEIPSTIGTKAPSSRS